MRKTAYDVRISDWSSDVCSSDLPDARAVISPIIGYDWIDVEAATARGVLVANGEASENYESMAEATIMLMLVSLYDLKSAENQLRDMRPRPRGPMSARLVKGMPIGIIGYVHISRGLVTGPFWESLFTF